MQFYRTKINVNANVMHQVIKEVTVPEFIILRHLHGKDALIDVEKIGWQEGWASFEDEWERLRRKYSDALAHRRSLDKPRPHCLEDIFMSEDALPRELPPDVQKNVYWKVDTKAALSDDELLAEMKERGLKIEEPPSDETPVDVPPPEVIETTKRRGRPRKVQAEM